MIVSNAEPPVATTQTDHVLAVGSYPVVMQSCPSICPTCVPLTTSSGLPALATSSPASLLQFWILEAPMQCLQQTWSYHGTPTCWKEHLSCTHNSYHHPGNDPWGSNRQVMHLLTSSLAIRRWDCYKLFFFQSNLTMSVNVNIPWTAIPFPFQQVN